MKDIVIIGAGDFGREVSWVVERINAIVPTWNLLGFVDDDPSMQNQVVDGYAVLGNISHLADMQSKVFVVCSIAVCGVRKQVMEQVRSLPNVKAATLIDPAAIIGRNVQIDDGCIITAGAFLGINSVLHNHVIVNIGGIVGHDTVLGDCCMVSPSTNLSGKIVVGSCVDIGTGTKVIQGINICADCIIGAGSVIVRDITEPGTYVGMPVRKIK